MRLCTRRGMDSLKEDFIPWFTVYKMAFEDNVPFEHDPIQNCNARHTFLRSEAMSKPKRDMIQTLSLFYPFTLWNHGPGVNPSFAWTYLDMPFCRGQMHEKMDKTIFLLGEVSVFTDVHVMAVSYAAPLPPVQIECPAQPLEHWTRAFSGIEKPWRVRLLWCLLCSRDACRSFRVLQPVVIKDGLGIYHILE